MDDRDPLKFARGWALVMGLGLLFYMLMGIVSCSRAEADDSLMLNEQRMLHISRPVSIVIVDQLPTGIKGCENRNYACAPNAEGSGRCIIYIKPSSLDCLFHGQQHCMGEKHGAKPSSQRCGINNERKS